MVNCKWYVLTSGQTGRGPWITQTRGGGGGGRGGGVNEWINIPPTDYFLKVTWIKNCFLSIFLVLTGKCFCLHFRIFQHCEYHFCRKKIEGKRFSACIADVILVTGLTGNTFYRVALDVGTLSDIV